MSTHGGTSASAPPATTVTGPDTIGAPAVVGTGLHYARNDHDHGLPALDYNAMQYNDLLGWTFDPALTAGTGNSISTANLQYCRIPLPGSLTVTNVLCNVMALGVTLTHSYLALYKSNGVPVGQSADQSTAWETGGATGVYTLPLVGGPYACTPLAANDFLWGAIYIGSFVSSPAFACAYPLGQDNNIGTTVSRARSGYIFMGNLATLPSFAVAGGAADIALYWLGIS
jgi:hypothetical protein